MYFAQLILRKEAICLKAKKLKYLTSCGDCANLESLLLSRRKTFWLSPYPGRAERNRCTEQICSVQWLGQCDHQQQYGNCWWSQSTIALWRSGRSLTWGNIKLLPQEKRRRWGMNFPHLRYYILVGITLTVL